MKKLGCLLNKHEVILYKVALDKGTLIQSDHFSQPAIQMVCQQLDNQLGEAMNQTYGPKVLRLLCINFLGE
jgi:hypothetical protein